MVLGTLRSATKSRSELVVENLALRQQLAVMKQRRFRPVLKRGDRFFLGLLESYMVSLANFITHCAPGYYYKTRTHLSLDKDAP